MKKRAFTITLLIISSIVFLTGSCKDEKPQPIIVKPDPEPTVFHECPNKGDIYKLIVDTIIFNSKGELYITNGRQIIFEYATIPLGNCAENATLGGTAKYSPTAAIVKTDEGKTRDMIWVSNGYIKNMILPEDVQRIKTFPDGKNVVFEFSLLNFNHDVIQTCSMTVIYKERFPDK